MRRSQSAKRCFRLSVTGDDESGNVSRLALGVPAFDEGEMLLEMWKNSRFQEFKKSAGHDPMARMGLTSQESQDSPPRLRALSAHAR